jgi:hypothetical protein
MGENILPNPYEIRYFYLEDVRNQESEYLMDFV